MSREIVIRSGAQRMEKDLRLPESKALTTSRDLLKGDSGNILKEYCIPDYILVPEATVNKSSHIPACPVMVFINSRSGGQLGGELLKTYHTLLNKNQVSDLRENAPDKVLHQLYANLEKHKQRGDTLATEIEKRLRIIVAGGDGTAGWLLGVVSDLKLPRSPPIATVPLGTGNNLPFAFGWGKKNPDTGRQSVEAFLNQVRNAKEMKIDSWHILLRMRAPKEGSCDPVAPLELPHSLHSFHHLTEDDILNKEGFHTFRGGFWNYFSMGMDAEISYAFHAERKLHPEKFKNQLVNQSTYVKIGCKQGWFCAPLLHSSSRQGIAQFAKVRVTKRSGQWEDLNIPTSIRSIVCLNLPSFSGGLNPWGTPNSKKACCKDLTPSFVDDGLIEVVGFRDAWHGLAMLAPSGHGTRLAQANKVCFCFHKSEADHTFMRIDGEPWKQSLPVDDEAVVVEISNLGHVSMLVTPDCLSKSIQDPSSPYIPWAGVAGPGSSSDVRLRRLKRPSDDGNDSNEEEEEEEEEQEEVWEERRKFGAADTFRVPDGVDLAHLI